MGSERYKQSYPGVNLTRRLPFTPSLGQRKPSERKPEEYPPCCTNKQCPKLNSHMPNYLEVLLSLMSILYNSKLGLIPPLILPEVLVSEQVYTQAPYSTPPLMPNLSIKLKRISCSLVNQLDWYRVQMWMFCE